jgi:ribonucleotide monophosphatase NagD (HAD superfamily)
VVNAAPAAIIVGKPSRDFFEQVMASTAASRSQTVMVGDDVFGDVEGALHAGLSACLVRTGKYRPGDENKVAGDFAVVDSVTEAVQLVLDAPGADTSTPVR